MSVLPVGILLAAGNSQRFGGNKLLHPLSDGTPMLLVSAKKLVSVLPDSVVVINQRLIPYTKQLESLGLRVVMNEDSDRGMGSSIACGIGASQHASGWLIALADMPYIKAETIALLANKLKNGADIVAPVLRQQRGHPVGFNQRHKESLMLLQDDVGAREIIKIHHNHLELISTDDAGVVMDIDQPEDVVR